jgi:hypothetical protein
MKRVSSASLITTILLGLVLALALGGCSRPPGSAAETAPSIAANTTPVKRTLTGADGQRLDVVEQPLAERPPITATAARTQADKAVPNAAKATAVEVRYIALTLQTDNVTRKVWLITYNGVEFSPSGCTCHVDMTTANTIIAVDGQTGAVALYFGADDATDAP